MEVPFLDLSIQYRKIEREVKEEINYILENNAYILGKKVEEFEKNFSKFCKRKYALGVNSGTSALHLALVAKGIKEGDEVITVPNTFIATVNAISYVGATPIFVDIDEKTYNMDVSKIEGKITEKTKAIIPVHLYGRPAEMDEIVKIAQKYNLTIIEDCCQAHGATQNGRIVPISGLGVFSFYPGKNLGAYGEGGAIVTDDEDFAKKIRILRNQGQGEKYIHKYVGYNYRMEGLQGAILNIKLNYLREWTRKRQENAKAYTEFLKDIVVTPSEKELTESSYHLYVIRAKERDKLAKYLNEKGISTGLHYPVPVHLQEAYSHLGHTPGDFPITEKYSKEILSLPMFPELSKEQIIFVSDKIKDFYREQKEI